MKNLKNVTVEAVKTQLNKTRIKVYVDPRTGLVTPFDPREKGDGEVSMKTAGI